MLSGIAPDLAGYGMDVGWHHLFLAIQLSHKQTCHLRILASCFLTTLFLAFLPTALFFSSMSSPYPYGQYPPPPNPYFQQGGYPYGPQGYYQPAPPPQVVYAPPSYQYQNDNTCCWACLAALCCCCAMEELC